MSGDVQPRKRKDKKKKKDESTENIPLAAAQSLPSTEDVNIHVHKEGGTGGNICAKIVFFILFSTLIVLIGLIIKENQGLTDLDNAESESRFSQIFEGWVDSNPAHHETHDDKDDVYDISEEHEADNNELHSEAEESEEEGEGDHEDDISEENDTEQEEEEDETIEDENNEDELEDESNEDDSNENKSEVGSDEENDQDEELSEEVDAESKEVDDVEVNEHSKENDEEEAPKSKENKHTRRSREIDEDSDTTKTINPAFINDYDEDGNLIDQTEIEALVPEVDKASTNQKEESKEVTGNESKVAVKFGVGVALLIVAYIVLIRKRKSGKGWRSSDEQKVDGELRPKHSDEKIPTPDLSRRNTLVAPPSLQEVEADIEQDEEDYSEEDEDISEDDTPDHYKSAKQKYQELQSTYNRSLTPETNTKTGESRDNPEFEETGNETEEDDEEVEGEGDEEDIEEEEEEGEEYDEDEDEELLKRLEAKYGKLGRDVNIRPDGEQEESGSEDEFANITNKEDYKIKKELDDGQRTVQSNAAYANKIFDALLQIYPFSPRCLYGKATALDVLAEKQQSNVLLQKSIDWYMKVLETNDVPDTLFIVSAERCINRLRFIGNYKKAIEVHKKLIDRFQQSSKYHKELAVTYLTINMIEEARSLLKEILSKWPDDGFALVHYGFILKTVDNNLKDAVKYMSDGLKTKATGVVDGRFYFHLGDALSRLGDREGAMKVYEAGVKDEVFMSKYQRSLYNVLRLSSKPWWEKTDLPYLDLIRQLENNWKQIRDEGLALLNKNGYFEDESEKLKDTGIWKQFELFARGRKNVKNCEKCPITCGIISSISDASKCKRGQTKFSVMHPGTHVWPHCGPTNCRLRMHLGLKVPPKTFIRVADDIRSWSEGQVMIFDDSFEHEVWHNGTDLRMVLIVDVWHPELTSAEKKNLSPI